MKLLRRFIMLFVFMFVNIRVAALALDADTLPEYSIKAGYLYHFALLTEWKERGISSQFDICVYGNAYMLSALSAWNNKTIKSIPLRAVEIQEISDIRDCYILYVSGVSKVDYINIIKQVSDYSILTVTDDPNLSDQSVSIFLRPNGKQIVFEINKDIASHAKLEFSSRLLRLSR